jgi:hypothetical protein
MPPPDWWPMKENIASETAADAEAAAPAVCRHDCVLPSWPGLNISPRKLGKSLAAADQRSQNVPPLCLRYPQPPFRVRDDCQFWQLDPGHHRRIIRTVRSYHSSQNYNNRQILASGATRDA